MGRSCVTFFLGVIGSGRVRNKMATTPELLLTLFLYGFFVYGVRAPSASCTNNCDVVVTDFKPTVQAIEVDTKATIGFNVTFTNTKAGNMIKEATGSQTNLDCTMMFAESNIGAGPATGDELEAAPTAVFSSAACTVFNKKDMKNGLYPSQPKSLIGECSITLPKAKCSKAQFLCVDCPKPATASYSLDENPENNKRCVNIKDKIFCDTGRKCYVGVGPLKTPMRCKKKDASCVAYRLTNSLTTYDCTTDEKICDDKGMCECKRCVDKDNCNVTAAGADATRFSIPVILSLFALLIISN